MKILVFLALLGAGLHEAAAEKLNLIAIIITAVAVLALVSAGIGFFIYKKKSVKRPPSSVINPEVMEQLNPQA